MTYTEHKITLDINKAVSPVSVRVKKRDTGRRLLIHLADSGHPYHISKDCYAVFTAKKPDGKVVFNDCRIEECVIVYDFTEQTVAVAGHMDCEIILYGADGKQLTSACFYIIVDDTIYDTETEIESSDEYNALSALIVDVLALKAHQTVDWYDLAPAIVDTTYESKNHEIYSAIGWPINVIVQGQTIQHGEGDPGPDNIREISGLGAMDAKAELDGNETWILTESVDAEKPRFRIALTGNRVSDLTDGATSFLSNLEIPLLAKGATYHCNQGYTISDGIMYVYIEGITTADDMASYFADNPSLLLYTKKTHTEGAAYYAGISMNDAEGYHGYAVELVRPLFDGDTVEIFTRHDGKRKCVETHIKKRIVLTGTENFVFNYTDAAKGLTQYTCGLNLGSINTDVTNNNGRLCCSHYPVGRDLRQVTIPNIWLYANNTLVLTDTYATAAELKAYLAAQYAAGTPVTVVYKLAEQEVHTRDSVSVVPGSMPCEVSAEGFSIVEYPHDTKHYIESRRSVASGSASTIGQVTLRAAAWVGTRSPYSQVVNIKDVTENSQVDLKPSVEQLVIFHDKDLAFVSENDDGIVTIYAIGDKPQNDYTIQVSITEVNT